MNGPRFLLMDSFFFVLSLFTAHVTCEKCRPIPLEDVRSASRAVYSISRDVMYRGGTIRGTSFKIDKIVRAEYLGQSLTALVATHGEVSLICFRGTSTLAQLLHQVNAKSNFCFGGLALSIF